MKALILPVLVSLSAAGGVFTANLLGGGASGGAAPAAESHAGDKADEHAKAEGEKGHGGEYGPAASADFMKFKRQFVVPVIKDEAVGALVLLNLGLEFEESKRDEIFRKEPRFRDAFIRELLQLSDRGYFSEEMTSPDTYEVVRETLKRAAKSIQDDGVTDILILDFSRQDR